MCVCHIVCVDIELARGKTWISLSSPRAWPSHVVTDWGCGLLAMLSIIECYCAAVQFPATPLHAIRQVRLACRPSFSHSCVSPHLFCPSAVSWGIALMEKHKAVILQNICWYNDALPEQSGRFTETVSNKWYKGETLMVPVGRSGHYIHKYLKNKQYAVCRDAANNIC